MAYWIGDRDNENRYAITKTTPLTYTIGPFKNRKIWVTKSKAVGALANIWCINPMGVKSLKVGFCVSSEG